jgi:hypothetical protein
MKKLQLQVLQTNLSKNSLKGTLFFVQNEYSPNMTLQTFRTPGKKQKKTEVSMCSDS